MNYKEENWYNDIIDRLKDNEGMDQDNFYDVLHQIVKEIDRLEKIGLTQDEIANDLSIKFNVDRELILNII